VRRVTVLPAILRSAANIVKKCTVKVAAPTTCMYARAAIEPIVIDRELKKTAMTMGALTGIGVVQNVSEGTKKVHFVLIASQVTFRHSSNRRSSVFAYIHRD